MSVKPDIIKTVETVVSQRDLTPSPPLVGSDYEDFAHAYDGQGQEVRSERDLKQEFLDDPLYASIIENPWFERLRGIAFLGALAYSENKGVNDTRRDHSLGVGLLAYCFSKLHKLPKPTERLFVSSALLHDIHHLPFSHTMEFALRNEIPHFSLTKETDRIICQSRSGEPTISDSLASFAIDRYTLPLFKRRAERESIFSWTHNVDTLDGILRANRTFFLANESTQELPFDVLLILSGARHSEKPYLECVATLDQFWETKNRVYSEGIYLLPRVLFERLFAYHLFHLCKKEDIINHLTEYRDEDFFEIFPGLLDRIQQLWQFIDSLTVYNNNSGSTDYDVVFATHDDAASTHGDNGLIATVRNFIVDKEAPLSFRFGSSWHSRYLIVPRIVKLRLTLKVSRTIEDVLGEFIQALIPTTK